MRLELVVEYDVKVPLRDGTALSADVYRPATATTSPVLVIRTPYGKQNRSTWAQLLFDVDDAVRRGYVVVAQDCRGTGLSEGRFSPIVQERADGHDTIEWAAAQDWSNGRVGIWGMSYMGAAAAQALVDAPDCLGAAALYMTSGDHRSSWGYCGDAFEFGFNVRWTLDQANAQLLRPGADVDSAIAEQVRREVATFWRDRAEFFGSEIDARRVAPAAASLTPWYNQLIDHAEDESFWHDIDVIHHADRVSVPILAMTGWQDGMMKSLVDLANALRSGGDATLASSHRLVIGPWDHAAYLSGITLAMAGARHFGPAAAGGRVGLADLTLNHFDRWLRDVESPDLGSAVRYFHMGPNRWVHSDHWPPPYEETRWHLWSGGRANTRTGDGILDPRAPSVLPPDSFVYDPLDPAPTVGGRTLLYPFTPAGFQDQGSLEDRSDVLVYTSPVLVEAVTVCGPVRAELFVRSSAPTTDICVTLVDVDPSGVGWSVADGARRLSVSEPWAVRPVLVDLWDTAYTFEAGHRIRLHVTSSSFPRFDRNPNVAPGEGGRPTTAVQQLLHDEAHPSALVMARPLSELS